MKARVLLENEAVSFTTLSEVLSVHRALSFHNEVFCMNERSLEQRAIPFSKNVFREHKVVLLKNELSVGHKVFSF